MDSKLVKCRQWLVDDQYEHGEFGKHELINPTDLPRTFNESLIKPNIFSSIIAYSALTVTGEVPTALQKSFNNWIESIRDDTGYWTSASGSMIPFSSSARWAKSNNLRHTAKCLDYYMLHGIFNYQDASIFNEIITCQLESGSFPQFKGMDSDLWSTAYFVNLLIRATFPQNLEMTLPRGETRETWKNKLGNKLNCAVDWLLSKLEADSLWHVQDANAGVITLAMMTEIGGHLAIYRPEMCATIIRALLKTQSKSASLVYVTCLTMDTLQAEEQAVVRKMYKELMCSEYTPSDLIDAASLCKLTYLKGDISILLYYRNLSNGHELQMTVETEWNRTDYFQQALHSIYSGKYVGSETPLQEADFWQYIDQSIRSAKRTIENDRGWELLWNGDTPVREERVQVYLYGQLQTICSSNNVLVSREQETGRGPVDFTFSNYFSSRCILEVKLASNQALKNGDFLAQVYEYARGLNVLSSFLAIVGFTTDADKIMDTVNMQLNSFREKHDDFYIQAIYIDASKKQGASKVNLKAIG